MMGSKIESTNENSIGKVKCVGIRSGSRKVMEAIDFSGNINEFMQIFDKILIFFI